MFRQFVFAVTFSIFNSLACTLLHCFDNTVFSVAKAVVSHQAIWSISRQTSGYQPKASPELGFGEWMLSCLPRCRSETRGRRAAGRYTKYREKGRCAINCFGDPCLVSQCYHVNRVDVLGPPAPWLQGGDKKRKSGLRRPALHSVLWSRGRGASRGDFGEGALRSHVVAGSDAAKCVPPA